MSVWRRVSAWVVAAKHADEATAIRQKITRSCGGGWRLDFLLWTKVLAASSAKWLERRSVLRSLVGQSLGSDGRLALRQCYGRKRLHCGRRAAMQKRADMWERKRFVCSGHLSSEALSQMKHVSLLRLAIRSWRVNAWPARSVAYVRGRMGARQ